MEPEKYECYNKYDKKPCSCLWVIISILFAFLLGIIGLILGAVFATTLVANLAVLIASAAILGFFLVLVIIYKICICKKRRY